MTHAKEIKITGETNEQDHDRRRNSMLYTPVVLDLVRHRLLLTFKVVAVTT